MTKKIIVSITGLIVLFLLINPAFRLESIQLIEHSDKELIGVEKVVDKNNRLLHERELEENIASENVYLLRLDQNKVLYQKQPQEEISIASLTKIMTTLVAIEQLDEIHVPVKVSQEMFSKLYEENLSVAGFLPNESVRAIDLLYGVMLPSGADAALALAQHLAGSEDNFVKRMNEKAKTLNMNHTSFSNVTGNDQANHYSTAEDIAILLKEALQNHTFKEIFTSERHSTASTSLRTEGITMHSTMFQMLSDQTIDSSIQIYGGKTGYTSQAGLCLASYAIINDVEYILITAGAEGSNKTPPYHIMDAILVYESLLSYQQI